MRKNSTLIVCEGAVMVAMAVVLNFLKVDLGPQGGSVNLVFIPLTVYALRRGPAWGIAAGVIFGTIKCLIGGGAVEITTERTAYNGGIYCGADTGNRSEY